MALAKSVTRNAVKKTAPKTLTSKLTTITYTAPTTPDYALQQLSQSSPFGFVTHDEGATVLKVIENLNTRVYEIEQKLQQFGLIG